MKPLILVLLFNATPRTAYDARSIYQCECIEGHTVFVHPDVLRHAEEAANVRQELARQLRTIREVVPSDRLAKLDGVRFWIEWEKKKNGGAEYHVSASWLMEHGYHPEKAGDIEISNARNFVNWSRSAQPWMVMHELAHAYHFQVLGEKHAGIGDAYRQAVERKLYDKVDYILGGQQRAYGRTNAAEYFAELTEAYFGKNDFFPFSRADLTRHDPVGEKLLREVWGEPRVPCDWWVACNSFEYRFHRRCWRR